MSENLIHASLSKGENVLVHFDQETKSLASDTADNGAQTVALGPSSSLPSFGSVSPVLVVPSVLVAWQLQHLQLLRFKLGGKEQNYLLLQSQGRPQWTSLAAFGPVSISNPVIVPRGIQYCDGQVCNKIIFLMSFVGNCGTFTRGYRAMVLDVEFLYHLLYLVICAMGLFVHEFFYSLLYPTPPSALYRTSLGRQIGVKEAEKPIDQKMTSVLFDLVYREETLLNVIKSVTRNGRSIILTAVLALILVYLFSIVGYLFFKDDFILEVDRLPNETTVPDLTVSSKLKCRGSSNPPTSACPVAGTAGTCHHMWLIAFFVEMGSCHVAKAGLELLGSSDPPALASQRETGESLASEFLFSDMCRVETGENCSSPAPKEELVPAEETEEDKEHTCETLLMCIVTVLSHGLRSGGGVGDVLRKPSKEVN
ncbi:Inositol 1,4,5-trisphosphate receptor type 1 [Plecturocebus cupreus]